VNDVLNMLKGVLVMQNVPAPIAERAVEMLEEGIDVAQDYFDTAREAHFASALANYAQAAALLNELPGGAAVAELLVKRCEEMVIADDGPIAEDPKN
jgi:hypothetical protein